MCIIAAFFGNLPFFGAFALLTFEEIHMSLPHCPKCNSEYTYEDNGMYICPECAYEWNDAEPAQESDELIVKDANGNLLADGDSVVITRDVEADKQADVTYVLEFTTAGGSHRLQYPKPSRSKDFAEGSVVTLYYDPEAPEKMYVEGDKSVLGAEALYAGIGVALLVLMFALL